MADVSEQEMSDRIAQVVRIFREADPEAGMVTIVGWLTSYDHELARKALDSALFLRYAIPMFWLATNLDTEDVYTAARHAAAGLAW